jgi:hypothetical protein
MSSRTPLCAAAILTLKELPEAMPPGGGAASRRSEREESQLDTGAWISRTSLRSMTAPKSS